jgi:hypothetical protein
MITEIGPNKGQMFFAISLQIVLILCLSFYCYLVFLPNGRHLISLQHQKDCCLLFLFFVFTLIAGIRLLFMPFWVFIDDENKTLKVKYLLSGPKLFNLRDITGYSTTAIKSRSQSSYGIFINLAKGKKILLSEINLDDYYAVELFLNTSHVKNDGEYPFSFISYYIGQLLI